ncbi:MAG: ADP-ribosylglycohydrolase family protein, partial [Abditibacteriales bacterium]|nr:ADP-ribosylglycohydrolase family protein [Abditibacteriales bacterium]MDW8367899.1 ADP-ribosylglycohydrolase family protein [Abditibacteriales bacterium]
MSEIVRESKFIGALLGTFVGDALGMPVEGWSPQRIARTFGALSDLRSATPFVRVYRAIFDLLADPKNLLGGARLGRGTYTDDTQMMIGVAESLADCGGFDGADMARRFVENFDPRRGYGPGAMKAIGGLRRGIPWNVVGTQLFGSHGGSFGNGAAMRVAPVGAFYYDDAAELRRVAELSASITHTHPLGKEGAALQAFAVACAVRREPGASFDALSFLDELRHFVQPDCAVFQEKLARIGDLLTRQPTVWEVVNALGNGVEIFNSVPTAIYAFLSHADSFKDAVVYAVSLGGDTDTIGAMTGAIAGALHGVEGIPSEWLNALENGEKGRDYVW